MGGQKKGDWKGRWGEEMTSVHNHLMLTFSHTEYTQSDNQLQRVGTDNKRGPRNPKYSISAFSLGAAWGPATSMGRRASSTRVLRNAHLEEEHSGGRAAGQTAPSPALLPHGAFLPRASPQPALMERLFQ